jgi:transcriptional regulator with XRE-family HTH domain
MSLLGNFLQVRLEELQITQRELALRLGLTVSHMSRILSGKRKGLAIRTVDKMLQGISPDRAVQAALLRAYLLDQCSTPARELVRIELEGVSVPFQETAPEGLEAAVRSQNLQRLAENPRLAKTLLKLAAQAEANPDFNRLLEHLTKLDLESST